MSSVDIPSFFQRVAAVLRSLCSSTWNLAPGRFSRFWSLRNKVRVAGLATGANGVGERRVDYDFPAVVFLRMPIQVRLPLHLDDIALEVGVLGVRDFAVPEPRGDAEVEKEPLLGIGVRARATSHSLSPTL